MVLNGLTLKDLERRKEVFLKECIDTNNKILALKMLIGNYDEQLKKLDAEFQEIEKSRSLFKKFKQKRNRDAYKEIEDLKYREQEEKDDSEIYLACKKRDLDMIKEMISELKAKQSKLADSNKDTESSEKPNQFGE